jgi:hypothetical protein
MFFVQLRIAPQKDEIIDVILEIFLIVCPIDPSVKTLFDAQLRKL